MKRRQFLTGLLSAPVAITTPGLLMPVKVFETSALADYPIIHYVGDGSSIKQVSASGYSLRARRYWHDSYGESFGHVFYHRAQEKDVS